MRSTLIGRFAFGAAGGSGGDAVLKNSCLPSAENRGALSWTTRPCGTPRVAPLTSSAAADSPDFNSRDGTGETGFRTRLVAQECELRAAVSNVRLL